MGLGAYLHSMFYLPKINFYLFHITPALILGFSNLILLNKIYKNLNFVNDYFVNCLSLFCLLFVNIFFYRLAEHGTDRSGMILILVAIIFLLNIINKDEKMSDQEGIDIIKFFIIFIIFVQYVFNKLPLIGNLFYDKTRKFF